MKINFIGVLLLLLIFAPEGFAQQGIRVMTFNIRFDNPSDGINSWGKRKGLVVKQLEVESPDIIGMQEVLQSQLTYLSNHLDGYGHVGVGRVDGKASGEFVPVLYKADRFKVTDWGTFWLSATPEDTGSVGWDAALPRICTWIRFHDLNGGRDFFFLNTHFDHMGVEARKESARLILDFILQKSNGLPVIVTGDFNCTSDQEPYRILTNQENGLFDACYLSQNNDVCLAGTFNGFGSADETERIDFILLKGDWLVKDFKLLKIKKGEMFISDHWPVLGELQTQNPEPKTNVVQTFTFDSIFTRRATFKFPEKGKRYEKILMYYTLKCDSLTPWDKYPCGEWDYTTYTRVYNHTGQMDSVKMTQPSFVVKGRSPKEFYYSEKPTYSYFEAWGNGDRGTGGNGEVDAYVRFEGSDYIEVPGAVFKDINNEITVAFWLNGDPFSQPMAATIFEGLDADGKRVINLHVPYDNGVVYWDAGGHGEGQTDNLNKAAAPFDYKGRWNYWVVTKNSESGEQRIYLNGKLFQRGNGLNRPMDGIATFRIGSNAKGTGKFYKGGIDDFALWNVELDSAQVEKLYLSNPTAFETNHLKFFYDFNKYADNEIIEDKSGHGLNGKCFGYPAFISADKLPYPDFKPAKGNRSHRDSLENPRISIILYGDSLIPEVPTDTIKAWPGWHYLYNGQGILIDSIAAEPIDTLLRRTWVYFGEPSEVIEPFEIARFITPYGKRLDLGLNGFTWIYDVTDYEPLLHGAVDLQAANTQELLDLKFVFIEGTPPRDVTSIRNVWPEGSYTYKELADDVMLQAKNLRLREDASTFMLRARISGHGHFGPFNCCEWVPKRHSWYLNGEKAYEWTVWRDCGMNPVYPQGGTWQFDRAGWCPGTFVDTYDFEMTSHLNPIKTPLAAGYSEEISPLVRPGETVTIDYGIEPFNLDNGEDGGNFEMAMQLFEYGAPNYKLDMELNDILAPSDRQEFRRMNPVSLNPVIRVKNTGSDTIRSFVVSYGLKGKPKSIFEWTGRLGFMQSADVFLPKPDWDGMTGSSIFAATIEKVNGKADERPTNDAMESAVTAPIILPADFIVHVKTQGFGRAADNSYKITDAGGNIIFERQQYADTTVYDDLIRLQPGAYDFTFYDKNEDGLIRHWWLYWEDKTKIGENGELKILDADKQEIIDLGYDWAEKRTLQFFVGEPE